MTMTVLQLATEACNQIQIDPPTTLVGLTTSSKLQYLTLFLATGRELRQSRSWAQLKRTHTIFLEAGRTQYPLPPDFFAAVPFTNWDQANRWENLGPLGDAHWNYRTYGYATIENRKAFRVFGPDLCGIDARGQFMINPAPGAASAGQAITFEYFSKTWFCPPSWIAGHAYTTADYVNCSGNIYQCSTNGTSTGLNPSVGFNGIGQDGGVFWRSLNPTAWVNTTLYGPQSYVTNGGNLYVCTTGGTSAGSGGPTGTGSASITDGTVSWSYCAAPTWVGQTSYTAGTFLKVSTRYYKNVSPGLYANATGISGNSAPGWMGQLYTWRESDTVITWDYLNASYETILTNNDLCLFDDDLMILGLKWRFLQAKRMEFQDYRDEWNTIIDTSMSRMNEGQRTSMAGNDTVLSGLRPNLPEGGFGL